MSKTYVNINEQQLSVLKKYGLVTPYGYEKGSKAAMQLSMYLENARHLASSKMPYLTRILDDLENRDTTALVYAKFGHNFEYPLLVCQDEVGDGNVSQGFLNVPGDEEFVLDIGKNIVVSCRDEEFKYSFEKDEMYASSETSKQMQKITKAIIDDSIPNIKDADERKNICKGHKCVVAGNWVFDIETTLYSYVTVSKRILDLADYACLEDGKDKWDAIKNENGDVIAYTRLVETRTPSLDVLIFMYENNIDFMTPYTHDDFSREDFDILKSIQIVTGNKVVSLVDDVSSIEKTKKTIIKKEKNVVDGEEKKTTIEKEVDVEVPIFGATTFYLHSLNVDFESEDLQYEIEGVADKYVGVKSTDLKNIISYSHLLAFVNNRNLQKKVVSSKKNVKKVVKKEETTPQNVVTISKPKAKIDEPKIEPKVEAKPTNVVPCMSTLEIVEEIVEKKEKTNTKKKDIRCDGQLMFKFA